jgi:hypothetical protein
VLLVFTLLITSFYFDALLDNHPVRWFYAATGLLMILLVSPRAASRCASSTATPTTPPRALRPRRTDGGGKISEP